MNTKFIVAALLIANSVVLSAGGCQANSLTYQCATDSNNGKCYNEVSNVVHLVTCKDTEICGGDPINECVEKKAPGMNGDSCTVNMDCFGDVCTASKCVTTEVADGQSCAGTNKYNCNKASVCIGDKCQAIKKENEECTKTEECNFGYACGSKASGENKKCLSLYSINDNGYSTNSLLCKSGYAFDTTGNVYDPKEMEIPAGNEGKCAESKLTSSEKCTQDSDCKYTIQYGSTKKTDVPGKCYCSFSGKASYCGISTDNKVWKNWVTTTQDEEKALKNVGSYLYEREHSFLRPKSMSALANKMYYAEFKGADTCTIKHFTGDARLLSFSLVSLLLCALFLM